MLIQSMFQFTPARGGRQSPLWIDNAAGRFNSRPHVAGDIGSTLAIFYCASFNSRPHVAGDSLRALRGDVGEVSIHARTWRATARDDCDG